MTIQTLLQDRSISQRSDLIAIARSGIESRYLARIQAFTSLSNVEISAVLPISQRQLARYTPKQRLNKEITSQLIQLIELFQKGYSLFGEKKFSRWIRTPNKVLDGNKPLEIMDTTLGMKMIEDVLGRIEHGVYS